MLDFRATCALSKTLDSDPEFDILAAVMRKKIPYFADENSAYNWKTRKYPISLDVLMSLVDTLTVF